MLIATTIQANTIITVIFVKLNHFHDLNPKTEVKKENNNDPIRKAVLFFLSPNTVQQEDPLRNNDIKNIIKMLFLIPTEKSKRPKKIIKNPKHIIITTVKTDCINKLILPKAFIINFLLVAAFEQLPSKYSFFDNFFVVYSNI